MYHLQPVLLQFPDFALLLDILRIDDKQITLVFTDKGDRLLISVYNYASITVYLV